MNYLEQIPKTGAYRFRRGIPAHLRDYFSDRGVVWREHLNTKDYAEARRLCLEVSAKVEGLLQQAQARHDAANGSKLPVAAATSVQLLKRLASDWRDSERDRRAQFVVVGEMMPGWPEFLAEAKLVGLPNFIPKGEIPQDFQNQFEAEGLLETEAPEGFMDRLNAEHAFICNVVQDVTRAHGLLIDERHPSHGVLWKLIRDAWIEVLESEFRWRTLDFSDLPSSERWEAQPAPRPVVQPNVRPQPQTVDLQAGPENPKFSAAFEVWVRLSRPAERTKMEAKAALHHFIAMHGDLPVRDITKRLAREFRDVLVRVPKNLSAAQKLMPLREVVEKAVGETRAPQTINKTLNLLGGILSRQSKEGTFDDLPWSNPFSVHLTVEDEDEDSYEPLSDTDLRAFFASPIFTLSQRPKQGRGETAYWAPLLVLFHGTRRQDVLQLFVRDIGTDPDTKVRFIDVNRDDGKKVKNAESVRQIPIHPMIIELGFLDWVAQRRAAVGPNASLWPGLEDRAKLYGRIGRWSKWFCDYLALNVVDDPLKKLHSFRGTFKRVGRGCGVTDPILDKICGHKIGTEGAKYGRKKRSNGARDSGYPLNILAEEIARVNFPGQEQIGRASTSSR